MVRYARHQDTTLIQQHLAKSGIAKEGKRLVYFSYGRGALYTLFKEKFAGKEIIFPAFICPSIILAAVKAGAKPRFIDVSLNDFNLDAGLISNQDLEHAAALFVNHTFGVPAEMEAIQTKIKDSPIYLIEDIAQALFAKAKGQYLGAFGDTVLVSMYKQTPNLSGAILVSDLEIREPPRSDISLGGLIRLFWLTSGPHDFLLKALRQRRELPEEEPDQKWPAPRQPCRLALALFALLLPTLKESVACKQIIAKHYQKRAGESPYFIPQQVGAAEEPAWFNFSVRLRPEIVHIRDALLLALRRKGIFCDRLWHDAPVALGISKEHLTGEYPNAQLLAKSVINLPIKAAYQESDVDYLFDAIEQTIQGLI